MITFQFRLRLRKKDVINKLEKEKKSQFISFVCNEVILCHLRCYCKPKYLLRIYFHIFFLLEIYKYINSLCDVMMPKYWLFLFEKEESEEQPNMVKISWKPAHMYDVANKRNWIEQVNKWKRERQRASKHECMCMCGNKRGLLNV